MTALLAHASHEFAAQVSSVPAMSAASQAVLQSYRVAQRHYGSSVTQEPVWSRFASLAATWHAETRFASSATELILNPAYQAIIGLGKAAVPIILSDLRHSPDYWFNALTAITGANPVNPGDSGNLQAMTDAWLNWGRTEGLID